MIVVKNAAACTGCLICEMVCSFGHGAKFSRSLSRIRVDKSLDRAEKGAEITFRADGGQKGAGCGLCDSEAMPSCVRFCPEDVLAVEGGAR